jgi:hypothetical protein
LPQPLSFLSPPRQPLPRVVVKHVTFDVRTHRILHPLVVIGGRKSSLSKFSRYGLVPTVVPVVPDRGASEVETFATTLELHCADGAFVPLSVLYPSFSACDSFEDIISLSRQLAPSAFDMNKAVAAHVAAPLFLDPTVLSDHVRRVSTLGLKTVLQQASSAVLPITLQPDVVVSDFSDVSTFENLLKIANDGVVTSLHSSFVANGGHCPTYDSSNYNSDVIGHLLAKGHLNGRFVIIPLELAQACCARENLTMHASSIFAVAKRDSDIGRFVIQYSFDGPNHITKKDTLPLQLGKIDSPQLGLICSLIENAHIQFPDSAATLGGIRVDIEGAFHRMKYSLLSSLLCSTQMIINGIVYAIFSLVALMGDQDVNYSFNQVTVALDETIAAFVAAETGSSLKLSSAYIDDFFVFGSPLLLDVVHDKIGLLIGDGRRPGLCSRGSAINHSKDIRGSIVETLGWLFDVPNKVVRPNYLTYAKLVYYFFVAIGDTPVPGQRVSVRLLMILGAHAMRTSNIITPLLNHSRSFHFNIRGNCDPSSFVYLNQTTVDDIYLWRCLLRMSFTDSRVLCTPTYAPLMRMKLLPSEPFTARGRRSELHATIVGYSDACTGTGSLGDGDSSFSGIGGYVPGMAWFGNRFSRFSRMLLLSGVTVDTNINILELLALVTTATLAIQQLQTMQSSSGCHIHIYCDNISAISKCRTHRSNHPMYTYLLHHLSLLQLRNRCTVGTSFLKGKDNVVADAASRAFQVVDSHHIFRSHLAHLPYMALSEDSINCMQSQLLVSPARELGRLPLLPIRLVGAISSHF